MLNTASSERMVIILNPGSGSSDEGFRERLEKAFQQRGAAFEIRETTKQKSGADLAREAREEGILHVAACGGDGTVMSVINGLGENRKDSPRVTLSIIPAGTANLLATALEIPTDPEEAVAVALDGVERDIDLGRRDDTLFALGIGIGLTERLVSQAGTEAKEKLGRFAYFLALIKEIGAKPHEFQLCLDGGKAIRSQGVAVVIANVGDLGRGMHFAPDAKPDDGMLNLCILHRFGVLDVFRLGFLAIFGGLKKDRELTFLKARRVELEAKPPLQVQIDGEPVEAKTPIVAEVLPNALRVRVPR